MRGSRREQELKASTSQKFAALGPTLPASKKVFHNSDEVQTCYIHAGRDKETAQGTLVCLKNVSNSIAKVNPCTDGDFNPFCCLVRIVHSFAFQVCLRLTSQGESEQVLSWFLGLRVRFWSLYPTSPWTGIELRIATQKFQPDRTSTVTQNLLKSLRVSIRKRGSNHLSKSR